MYVAQPEVIEYVRMVRMEFQMATFTHTACAFAWAGIQLACKCLQRQLLPAGPDRHSLHLGAFRLGRCERIPAAYPFKEM
jgi:hypothetical protein